MRLRPALRWLRLRRPAEFTLWRGEEMLGSLSETNASQPFLVFRFIPTEAFGKFRVVFEAAVHEAGNPQQSHDAFEKSEMAIVNLGLKLRAANGDVWDTAEFWISIVSDEATLRML